MTAINTQKARALFAYLCMHPGKTFSRVFLATLLWPDQSAEKSSHSLRQALSVLRKKMPNGQVIIQADRFQISYVPNAHCWLDVTHFEQLAQDEDTLEEAVTAYSGPFLDGFYLNDSVEFETWMLHQRERLQNKALSLLEKAAENRLHQGDYERAKRFTQQLIKIDPLHELAYQSLMLIHARQGDFNRGIAVFQQLKQILTDELGVEPIGSSLTLFERIRAAKENQGRNRLPALTDQLIGRNIETLEIINLLNQPDRRLITVLGPGGVGKTCLALQVAQQLKKRFLNGVFFVSLGPLNDEQLIPREIADAIGFKVAQGQQFESQLLQFLANREMLLILDNFEHLLSGSAFVGLILQETADVSILATSREPLNLHSEQRFPLLGLPFAADDQQSNDDAQKFASYQLFVRRVQRVEPAFNPAGQSNEITTVCRLLEGVPLGIELAAAQLETHSLTEVVSELSKSFDALEKDWVDRPDRHRSLKAAFLHSWHRLDHKLKVVLGRLSVFRGGFDLTAAREIAGASRDAINQLMQKSLLRKGNELGRYDMHPVVQEYAAEEVDSNELEAAKNSHTRFFLNSLKIAQEDGGFGADVLEETIYVLGVELGNLRLAWQHSVEVQNLGGLSDALTGISKLYAGQSWFREGSNLFNWTIGELEDLFLVERPDQDMRFWGHLNGYAAGMSLYLSEIERAKELAQRSIAILEPIRALDELGYAWNMLGISQIYSGNFTAAVEALEKSIGCYQQTGNDGQMLGPLVNLGSVYQRLGKYEEGLEALQSGYEVSAKMQDRRGSAHLLNNIGGILFSLGRLEEAADHFKRCVTLCNEMGYPMVEASALFNLAEIELNGETPNQKQVQSWLETGVAICQKIGDRQKLARGHKLTADYLMLIDQPEQAWENLIDGMNAVWEVKALPSLFEVLIGVAKYGLKYGRSEMAAQTLALIVAQNGVPQHLKQQAVALQDQNELPEAEEVDLDSLIKQILAEGKSELL